MPYPILELELSEPLPTLSTGPNDTGLALILRYQDQPVGFLMKAFPPQTTLSAEDLSQWVEPNILPKMLQEQIYGQIKPVTSSSLPSLTVAICTKDRTDNLRRCLNSLLPLQQHGASQLEILVVDNAPSDQQTYELVHTLPTVRYTCEPKPGLDFARNHALQASTTELLAFLDDDVAVDRLWLEGLTAAFCENPDAGGVTGLVLPYELNTEAQILFEERGGFQRGFEKIRYGQQLKGNALYPCGAGIFGAGCNMAFRRSLLLELGGFDNALDTGGPMPGGGDLDIFYRVVRSGHPLIYEPSYLVFHQHRPDLTKLRRQYWSWGLGFMAFVVKSYFADHEMRSQFRQLVLWWFKYQLTLLGRSILQTHTLPIDMVLAEIWGGITGLFGGYGRSQRRIQSIQDRFKTHPI